MRLLPYYIQLLIVVGVVVFVPVLYFLVSFAINSRPRRPKEPGVEYIYVENDGCARELDEDEVEYLATEFHGADGNRPYIKRNYEERTPDGKLHGYLRRRQLPKRISIDPARSPN